MVFCSFFCFINSSTNNTLIYAYLCTHGEMTLGYIQIKGILHILIPTLNYIFEVNFTTRRLHI